MPGMIGLISGTNHSLDRPFGPVIHFIIEVDRHPVKKTLFGKISDCIGIYIQRLTVTLTVTSFLYEIL